MMRQRFPFRRVVLGLPGKIDLPARHPGDELVAQIWSQIHTDSHGLAWTRSGDQDLRLTSREIVDR
jgi:hypothetical protein